MTAAFIITLALFLFALMAYIIKKGELNAIKDDFNQLEEITCKKDELVTEYGDRIEKLAANLKEADDSIAQFRSKVDELLVSNEGLKNEIAGRDRKVSDLQSKISDLQSKLKYVERLHGEKEKELARYTAEARDLRGEYDALQKVYDELSSRLVTVSREMPVGLVSSRKAERLSVSLRQYITETPEGASLQIVAPFPPADASDEK